MSAQERHEELRRRRNEWEGTVVQAALAKRPEREPVTTVPRRIFV